MSGSKWQARQELEHLDGSHAQRNASHDADIVDQPGAETVVVFVARALPGALDVCPYCFDEPADVAAQQSLHRRKRAALRHGLGSATTGFFCSPEHLERVVERVDEQVGQPQRSQAVHQIASGARHPDNRRGKQQNKDLQTHQCRALEPGEVQRDKPIEERNTPVHNKVAGAGALRGQKDVAADQE